MNVILHKDDNGNNLLTSIAKGYNTKAIQEEIGGVEVSSQFESFEVDFLNAYDITNNAVSLNLEKARDIKVDMLRNERNQAFIAFDKRYEIALRDESEMSGLKLERQKLKDAPAKAEEFLNSCISIEEIKALTLQKLL